jgi:hypothetical protein
MGEVWEAADAVNQRKTEGHEGQRKAVYDPINQYFHLCLVSLLLHPHPPPNRQEGKVGIL